MFKLATSIYSPDTITLNFNLVEGYTGSLDASRKIQNSTGGPANSFFLGNVESNSPNIEILVHPSIASVTGSWLSPSSNTPTKKVRTYKATGLFDSGIGVYAFDNNCNTAVSSVLSPVDQLFPLGSYQIANTTTQTIGAIPDKVNRLMSLIADPDNIQIDVSIEAGLGTIYTMSRNCATLSASNSFDDTQYLNLSGANGGFYKLNAFLTDQTALNIQADYTTVVNTFVNFAQFIRKDHIHISDTLRNIYVQGANNLTLANPSNSFSIALYWPLKHLYEFVNTSYMAAYANWFECYDGVTDAQFWCPPSGSLAGIYANTDATYQPWYAPAGFQRGIVPNVQDLAIIPNQAQRDMIYPLGINPITQFPTDGIVVMGQKTLYGLPSAFNRVNVRRLFLFLEKATRATMKYFLFEANNSITRNRVVNNLTPIFELAKNTQGVYDYKIICSELNNPGNIIDQNILVVDIYIKPERAAEFILCNFYATQTSFNFDEITQ